jgi:hypothetical protein
MALGEPNQFWLFKPFNFKRRVSSNFVAKTMWKLSFLKYGNTHLISELYYKKCPSLYIIYSRND